MIWVLIPLISAAIGWLTNWMAVRMLFRPRRPLNCLGLRVQGLIPRRQKQIAAQTAEIVEREFISQHLIRSQVEAMDVDTYLKPVAREVVAALAEQLRSIPLVGAMVNDSALAKVEGLVLERMRGRAGPMLVSIADEVEARIQVRDLVRERIEAFDLDQLESVVHEIARREFRLIEWLGAVVGFIVGLVQVLLLRFLT